MYIVRNRCWTQFCFLKDIHPNLKFSTVSEVFLRNCRHGTWHINVVFQNYILLGSDFVPPMEISYHDSDLRVPIPSSSQNIGIVTNCQLTCVSVNVTSQNFKDEKFQNVI